MRVLPFGLASAPASRGYLAVLGYCIVTAVSLITVHEAEKSIAPPAVTFYAFLATALFFSLASVRTLPRTFRVIRADKAGFFAINLTTAATWLTGFWAVKYLAPDLFLTIFMGIAPLATFIARTLFFRLKGGPKELAAAVLVTLAVAAVVAEHMLFSDLPAPPLPGLLLAAASGVSFSFYLLYSRKMQEELSPAGILAVRFYLLLAASLALTMINFDLAEETARISFWKIAVIALGSAILPLYLLQTAIVELGPARVANFVPFTCVVTYLAQQAVLLHPFSPVVFLTILLLCALIGYSARMSARE